MVEPIVTKQWYVRMADIAKPARDAVADGDTRVIPERFAKVYFNWMDGIRDWCISRQLWWGHRVPVWYCGDCPAVIVEMEDPTACAACGSDALRRDEDVLDTWFSSALWPHSTLGWPDADAEDMDYFYPTSVMETGYDILFFWVARMMMMGIENTGKPPFHTVYLHGLVLDPEGVKMSKTRGNVLDPLELIEMYGADALRFALTVGNSPGNDQRINEQKLESSRNFANKVWNMARFVMGCMEGAAGLDDWRNPPPPVHRQDRWIMSRLNRVAADADGFMRNYQFGEAQRAIHDFVWREYADWYIEMAKVRLRADEAAADGEDGGGNGVAASPLPYLVYVLERVLRLLHPFMPFVTEEIWQTLVKRAPLAPDAPPALIVAAYPQPDDALFDDEAEADIEAVMELVRAVRNLRAEFRIQQHQRLEAAVDSPRLAAIADTEASAVKALARVEPLRFGAGGANGADAASGGGASDSVSLVLSGGSLTVPLGGLVDLDAERERLRGEIADIESNRQRLAKRLSDENFLTKAPEEVIERERGRLDDMRRRKGRAEEILARLDG